MKRTPVIVTRRDVTLLAIAAVVAWFAYLHKPELQYLVGALTFTACAATVSFLFMRAKRT